MNGAGNWATVVWLTLGMVGLAVPAFGAQAPITAKHIVIVTGAKSTPPELAAADIMSNRLERRSGVSVQVVGEHATLPDADITFVVGTTKDNSLAKKLVKQLRAVLPTLPDTDTLHPEGFAVKSGKLGGKPCVVIAGVDGRGTIYGVGWMLRDMTYLPGHVLVPARVNVTDKPAFWLRGGNPHGPGSRAREYGRLRPRTQEEFVRRMEDQMLLGTNVFGGDPKVIRGKYGMMTTFGRTANEMDPGFKMPKGWGADNDHSTKYVCPSVPAARKALLESFDKFFRKAPDYDFFTTNSGDEGGCRDKRCMPWGGTYIKLVHQIADILHKYHPNCKVLATNQDLTNAGNQALFRYLNKGDSSWLYAIRYGPGADEMQTYIRGPVNPRWFKYEGFGPLGNYLKYMYHELPATTNIALYTDITHWMQSQYGVPHPDINLAAIYERRSWNARPRTLYKVAREIFHYAIGGMHYSEGMHDDFNEWLWYRFMWNPNQSVEAITKSYCRYWFGPEAASDMTKAIFLMEQTLEKPVLGNPGIEKAVELTRAAGKKIPPNLLKNDWRWRVISEKALMDRYIQLELEHGVAMKKAAAQALATVDQAPRVSVEKAVKVLDQPVETAAMKALRAEAMQRGEESNKTVGYREPVVFFVDKFDLTETGWWKQTLEKALETGNDAQLKNAARMVLHYADPGPGGFYDDLGWPAQPKHLVSGETLWGFRPFPGPAMHSQWNLGYGTSKVHLALAYKGLDPHAQYVVRVTVGTRPELKPPKPQPVDPDEAARMRAMAKATEHLEADGTPIGKPFRLPMDGIEFHEFDVPKAAIHNGKLDIQVVPGSKKMPYTILCEIWLMKKDHMPWTTKP